MKAYFHLNKESKSILIVKSIIEMAHNLNIRMNAGATRFGE